ncbi:MAG TPA: GNAT family N-acetyltransferase [Acidimicrobiales bacterium]
MTIEFRNPPPQERRAAADAFRAALLHPPVNDEDWAKSEPSWEDCDSVTAWDGDRCVGHAGAFRFQTTVPGGARLATAGVTRVGVLPTHTRRGILNGLMSRLLTEAHDRGQVLASLRASEAVIYERYGFGVAAEGCEVEIDRRRAQPRPAEPVGTCRLLRADEVMELIPPLYDRLHTRAGMITRPDWMWRRYLESATGGAQAGHVVVHVDDHGELDGYAHYEVSWDAGFGRAPRGVAELAELWGATPTVEADLWRYLLGIDLIEVVRAEERPVDDIARWLLANRRAYQVKMRWDEQWLRLLDVDAALRARSYGPGDAVTIAVTDPLLPANDGAWRISPAGAERVEGEKADLTMGITTLGAGYLGGTTWTELVASGRAVASDPGATASADALFATRPAPFCGSFF